MTAIKKQFADLYEVLEASKNKKVSTILPQLVELMSKKQSSGSETGSTFIKNDAGEVVAIYCYYHKKWELVADVEYGAKASNKATGLNTMCKEGVSNWSKQQRAKKAAEADILEQVINGELTVEDVQVTKDTIIATSQEIKPREDGHGFDTAEELSL